ncbi:MAG: hypothetical protein HYZ47_02475 [Simkania negevensis]|nr:hypothetical protein [Simkania negevensis]
MMKRYKPLLIFNSIGALFFSILLFYQAVIFPAQPKKREERAPIDRSLLKKRLASCTSLQLQEMAKAGERMEYWERVLSKTKDSILTEVFKGAKVIYESKHYPMKKVFDQESHGQYYYHTHRKGEHGHFHLFLWKGGIPPKILPLVKRKESRKESYAHLIAISMASSGQPLCFFTTNQWVTGEDWYKGEDILEMLPLFQIEHAYPSWVVNQWLQDLLILFRPQLIDCIKERDQLLSEKQEKKELKKFLKDQSIEMLSQIEISIKEQLQLIREILKEQEEVNIP